MGKELKKVPVDDLPELKKGMSIEAVPSDVEVRIEFPNLSKEQMEHLFNAERELMEAGIHFDTGYDLVEKRRDWEFDWSLKGARVVRS